MTTTGLSNDNTMLKEELDTLRGQVLQAKNLSASLQCQLDEAKAELEAAKRSSGKGESTAGHAVTAGSVGSDAGEGDTKLFEARLSDLKKRAKALEEVKVFTATAG